MWGQLGQNRQDSTEAVPEHWVQGQVQRLYTCCLNSYRNSTSMAKRKSDSPSNRSQIVTAVSQVRALAREHLIKVATSFLNVVAFLL